MSRVGILGGSFDPPHVGHAMMAREARQHAGLDMVLFVPAGEQWLKDEKAVASAAHRLSMTHLLIGADVHATVSDVDIRRPGPTYTVDTIRELRETAEPGTDYVFILGEDSLADLPRWRAPQELVTLCRFVVLPREDESRGGAVAAAYDAIPGLRERVTVLGEAPRMPVSSSSIRRMLREGGGRRGLVPNPVLKYITAHRLYGRSG